MKIRFVLPMLGLLATGTRHLHAQADTALRGRPATLDSMRVTGYRDSYAGRAPFSALRVDAELTKIPLSISVVPHDVLLDQAASGLNDAMKSVAGVTPQTNTLTRPNFFALRGFYSFSYRDGVRMMVDGEPPLNAMTIESIEVLKGPSSILYGRGEPGGMVNFVSKHPLPVNRQLFQLQYGSNDSKQFDLDLTGPMGGGNAYRFIAGVRDDGSYRDNVSNNQFYVNPTASFSLGARTTLDIGAEIDRYATKSDAGVIVPQSGIVPAYFSRSSFMGEAGAPKSKFEDERYDASLQSAINDHWQLRASLTHERPREIGYTRLEAFIDAGPTGFAGLLPANTLYRLKEIENGNRQYTNGRLENVFSFGYPMGDVKVGHQLMVMADWRQEKEDVTAVYNDFDLLNYTTGVAVTSLPTPYGFAVPFGQKQLWDETTHNVGTNTDVGASLQDLISVGSKVNLLVGLRYESNKIESVRTGGYTQNAILGGQFTSEASSPPTSTTSHVAPRFGVLAEVAPGVRVYGSYLTSFEAPIPGLLTKEGKTLNPEIGAQYEGGVKADLFDGRAVFSAAVFDVKKTDAIVIVGQYGQNVGEEHVPGYEADLAGNITKELRTIVSFAHQDMKFTKGDTSLIGKTRPGLPKNTASVWALYDLGASVKGLTVGAGAFYRDVTFLNSTNKTTLPGGTSLDAMLGYTTGRWTVQLNAFNLTNLLLYSPSGGFSAGTDPNIFPSTVLPSAPSRVVMTFRYGT